jgi:hypothetical protein
VIGRTEKSPVIKSTKRELGGCLRLCVCCNITNILSPKGGFIQPRSLNLLTVGILYMSISRLSRPKQANFFGSIFFLITRNERGCVSSVSRCSLYFPLYKMSRWFLNLLASNLMFTFFAFVLAANGLLTDLLGSGSAHHDEPFWMEKIKHQGISPFNPNATEYKVFRNVKVGTQDLLCF